MPVSLLPNQSAAWAETFPGLTRLGAERVDGLYVHVPFCFHKCHYCDFYSIVNQSPERMGTFVGRVLAEAAAWQSQRPVAAGDIQTVFFGGGTPSLLPAAEMIRLISGLRTVLQLNAITEWTIECNPATVEAEYLEQLRAAGVDRLSFGAQSFDRNDLAALERHHEPEDVPRSIELARRAGFGRLSVDLIFGVPGQTLASYEHSLGRALGLDTGHVSAYLLTYEPNTPMGVKNRLGQIAAAPEELEVEMLQRTRERVRQAGLQPYEISNHARPGDECQHNLMYWRGGNYIGLGPGAASHIGGHRWRNAPHLGKWEQAVDAGRMAAIEHEDLSPEQRHRELGYLQIRLMTGVPWSSIPNSKDLFREAIEKLLPLGLIEVDESGFRLSEKGIPLCDAVASELL